LEVIMPRYLVERTVSEEAQEDLPDFGSRMKRAVNEKFPDMRWEHSHVVSDESTIKTFCVYEAPDEEMVRQHAAVVGDHVVGRVYEIAGDVTPADFAG
jgi:Nickel responsive protein SCO4226-like